MLIHLFGIKQYEACFNAESECYAIGVIASLNWSKGIDARYVAVCIGSSPGCMARIVLLDRTGWHSRIKSEGRLSKSIMPVYSVIMCQASRLDWKLKPITL